MCDITLELQTVLTDKFDALKERVIAACVHAH